MKNEWYSTAFLVEIQMCYFKTLVTPRFTEPDIYMIRHLDLGVGHGQM